MAPHYRLWITFFALVILFSTCLAKKIMLRGGLQERKLPSDGGPPEQLRLLPPVQAPHGGPKDDLELLDLCLVASVDGKFHALNRSTGQVLWSMNAASSSSSPTALNPLIRTQHNDPNPDDDDDEHRELYIIEPQSGDIYVLPSADAPLQRLPFSMAQLVDMSPYGFSGDDEHRLFVGRKETSLLSLELETGRLKGTINSESECAWDPFGDLDDEQLNGELDLDELDGTKPPKVKPVSTEVLIGRTDYYVSIHTRPKRPSDPKPPVQVLMYSTYGPNNEDHLVQATYRRTPDDMYVQAMPNGEIMSFRTSSSEWTESRPLWGNTFKSPIVAVFDVLQTPNRRHPMVLLQPQPRLQDFIPNFDFASNSQGSYNLDVGATYVGLVEDGGSLFALSPSHYPLVVFAQNNYLFARQHRRLPSIEAPPGYVPVDNIAEAEIDIDTTSDWDTGLLDLPPDVDGVTRMRKAIERCADGRWDRACVVGKRPVAASGQSRLSRLLPGRSAPEPDEPFQSRTQSTEARDAMLEYGVEVRVGEANFSEGPLAGAGILSTEGVRGKRALSGGAMALAVFLVGMWYLTRKVKQEKGRIMETKAATIDHSPSAVAPEDPGNKIEEPAADRANADAVHVVDFAEHAPIPPPGTPNEHPSPVIDVPADDTNKLPVQKSPDMKERPMDKTTSPSVIEDVEGDEESDHEGDNPATPGKKKGTRRRKRGKKNKGGNVSANVDDPVLEVKADPDNGGENADIVPSTPKPAPVVMLTTSSQSPTHVQQLVVSDEVLGYGSHGTVVYRGSLQGRAVAVKRLLQDFVTLASREVNILQESDDHPNVIRYYYQEAHTDFLYIALELCPASLADVVERPDLHRDISNAFDPKRALLQITAGLRHLHALKIVHRDIKPQNILVSAAKRGAGSAAGHRMLISDFGLCKRLEVDQTSFLPTANGAAAGTAGWRAPEILRGEVKLDDSAGDDSSQSSRGSVGTIVDGPAPSSKPTRLTKSVDIFALGCLFYYILTSGSHPYGDRYERDVNIMKGAKSLSALESFGEEGLEAIDLITSMLDSEASKRPDTTTCLTHPFFWNPTRRLAFLQDASDRFEIMCRDPRDADLIELEKGAFNVVGNDWQARLDKIFLDNLGKFRKYDGKSVQDLMRALRNKKHHYQDLPDNVKRHLGPLPEGFLAYFTRRFPHLFMHVHSVISRTNLRYESMFKSYFEPTD